MRRFFRVSEAGWPDEAQIPSLSSKINRASDSIRWKKPLAVFAGR